VRVNFGFFKSMRDPVVAVELKSNLIARNVWSFFSLSMFGLFSILLSVSFGITSSLIVTFFFGLSAILGAFIYIQIGRRKTYSALEILGVGIAIGTIIPALSGLLLRSYLGIPTETGFVVLLILALTSLTPIAPTKNIEISSSPQLLAVILPVGTGAAFACFNHLTYLFVSICICGILLVTKLHQIRKRFTTLGYLLTFSAASLITRYFDNQSSIPSWRAIIGLDQFFDEAQSASISRFGTTDNFFVANAQMPGHVLTHAWAGASQTITHSPVFMVSGAAGILLGNLGVCALIGGIVYRWTNNVNSVIASLAIWVFQASLLDQYQVAANARMANSISLLWFTFAWFVLLEFKSLNIRFPLVILPILIGAVGLAKIHWAIYIIVVVGLLSVFEYCKSKNTNLFIIAISSSFVLISTYLIFMRGLNAYAGLSFNFSIYLFLGHLGVFMLRNLAFADLSPNDESTFIKRCIFCAAIIFIPLIAITGADNAEAYFVICTFVLIALLQGPNLSAAWDRVQSKSLIQNSYFVLIFISVSIYSFLRLLFYDRIENSSRYGIHFLIIEVPPDFLIFLFISGLCIFGIPIILRIQNPNYGFDKKVAISFVIISFFVVNSTNFLFQSIQPYVYTYMHGTKQLLPPITDGQFDVGRWLMDNTVSEDIIATNHYCQTRVLEGERTPIIDEKCRHRNMDSWISATSHRRMLLEAPMVSVLGPGTPLNKVSSDRYNLSLDFAQHPTTQLLQALKAYKVSWFVLEMHSAAVTDWNEFGQIVFENADYKVLKLK